MATSGRRLLCLSWMLAGVLLHISWVHAAEQSTAKFLVFDGLLYNGKPDLKSLGMIPIRGINPPAGYDPGAALDEAKVRATMADLAEYAGAVYLDYEEWAFDGRVSPATGDANISKYLQVLRIARDASPHARIGFYAVVPCMEYWAIVANKAGKLREWNTCNARAKAIANRVDVLFPSLYTYYDDQRGWDLYAEATIREARRYGRPVYVFLWPEYHIGNIWLRGKNIPGRFWRHELEFCRERADGIVIWGGWQKQWDADAPWWKETQDFLRQLK